MKIQYILIILVSTSLFVGCKSSNIIAKEAAALDTEFVDYLFKDYSGNQPSASIIIIKDGKIELAKSYGYADIENGNVQLHNLSNGRRNQV